MAAKRRQPNQTGAKFVMKIASEKWNSGQKQKLKKNLKFPILKFCKSRGNLSGSSLYRNTT